MIFTDFIRKHGMEPPSVLDDKDFKIFDKKVWNDGGKTLNWLVYNPDNVTLFFKGGFVCFKIGVRNFNGYDNDTVCEVMAFYRGKNCPHSRDTLLKHFWHFLKVNKCTKVNMSTKIKPEFWINNYGFELVRYEMELNL
tara:strand:+ start:548 stop:961 length:414 start_codon:yes stop_codon:yes gene_type:complete